MERGLLMPKLLLKLMLSQDMDTPEDMVDMAVTMEVMVVMDMERGLLKLMLRLDMVDMAAAMVVMEAMAEAMEDMVVMDMARGLLMPRLDMVDMAAVMAVMEAMAEAMVVMDTESKCYICYISPLTKIIIPVQTK